MGNRNIRTFHAFDSFWIHHIRIAESADHSQDGATKLEL